MREESFNNLKREAQETFRDVEHQPIIEQCGSIYKITAKHGNETRISFRSLDGARDFQEAVQEAMDFINGKY